MNHCCHFVWMESKREVLELMTNIFCKRSEFWLTENFGYHWKYRHLVCQCSPESTQKIDSKRDRCRAYQILWLSVYCRSGLLPLSLSLIVKTLIFLEWADSFASDIALCLEACSGAKFRPRQLLVFLFVFRHQFHSTKQAFILNILNLQASLLRGDHSSWRGLA